MIDCRQMKWAIAFIGIIVLASGNLFAQTQTPSAIDSQANIPSVSEDLQKFVGTWIYKGRIVDGNATTIMKIGQYPDGIEIRFKRTFLYDDGEERTIYYEGENCRLEDGILLFTVNNGVNYDWDAEDTHSGIRIGHSKSYTNYRLSRKGSTIDCKETWVYEYYDRRGYLITPRVESEVSHVYSREEDNW